MTNITQNLYNYTVSCGAPTCTLPSA